MDKRARLPDSHVSGLVRRACVGNEIEIFNTVDQSLLTISMPAYQASVINDYLLQHGARPVFLDGARGLTATLATKEGRIEELWFVVKGAKGYLVVFTTRAAERAIRQHGVNIMLDSWRWSASA